jgi:GNAT superfamily N-acetyltransferase
MGRVVGWRESENPRQYLSALAEIHERELTGDFMPALGRFFLRNVLYRGALSSNRANVYLYIQNGQLAGHVIYAYDMTGFLVEIFLKRLPYVLITLVTKVAPSRRLVRHVLEVCRSVLSTGSESVKAETIMLVIDPRFRGKGIADALFRAMVEDLRVRGITTLRGRALCENVVMLRVFERTGWRRVGEMEFLGRRWVNLVRDITVP